MSDINCVCISGWLICDPVMGNPGMETACFTVASNEYYPYQTGILQRRTAFVYAKVFGDRAQTFQDRKMGGRVIVPGKLRTEGDGSQSPLVLIWDEVKFLKLAWRHLRG
jgi:single-stranded DNA-binding protein